MSIRRIERKRFWSAEHGAAMVEMAISMVILVTLLFGVIEMCLALYSYHFVSEAAREGTRYAIVRGSACQFPSACPATGSDIQSYVQNLGLPGINPSAMTVTTAWTSAGAGCTPSASCNNPGNRVQVTVQYKFPLSIPFIPISTLTMSSTSAMIISQ